MLYQLILFELRGKIGENKYERFGKRGWFLLPEIVGRKNKLDLFALLKYS